MEEIEVSEQFRQVLDFVNHTSQLIFLTGKAGTGKTTLLKYIRENSLKQMGVVAPTGVAAVNAGGATIHSFFQFPFGPFVPAVNQDGTVNVQATVMPVFRYNSQRLQILKNLELLVIDEVSMVRADLLDLIDLSLRQVRRKSHLPFGGVQVLLIGDMYQLPPVVQNEEASLLKKVYRNPYFFESLVIRANPPVYIELRKIYRQNEKEFIDLLNKVRNNQMDAETLNRLNAHYRADLSPGDYQENITLTTHNRKADEINARNLNQLPDRSETYHSAVEGQFPEKSYPADPALQLKKGARVMFIKNNTEKNYYNGKIGKVVALDKKSVCIKCPDDDEEIEVFPETWNNISYAVNKENAAIEEEILGTFTQFPLRLAWAITIHKSQGLTFDKVIIDAAEAFSAGQVYVALSRCKGLSGLILSSRINSASLLNDKDILNFSSSRQSDHHLSEIYRNAQARYFGELLNSVFDFTESAAMKSELASMMTLHQRRLTTPGREWFSDFSSSFDSMREVALKFGNQLSSLLSESTEPERDQALQERIGKAAGYFEGRLSDLLSGIRQHRLSAENKEAAMDIGGALQNLNDRLELQRQHIASCRDGFIFTDYIRTRMQVKIPEFRISIYASSKNSRVSPEALHPALYRLLLQKRDEICREYQKDVSMVANSRTLLELCNYLPQNEDDLLLISGFGKKKVAEFGDEFLHTIRKYCSENDIELNDLPSSPKMQKGKKSKVRSMSGHSATKTESLRLFRLGLSVEEIARERQLVPGTVATHLTHFVKSGEVKITELISESKLETIVQQLEKLSLPHTLSEIKALLPPGVSYHEIKWALAASQMEHNRSNKT